MGFQAPLPAPARLAQLVECSTRNAATGVRFSDLAPFSLDKDRRRSASLVRMTEQFKSAVELHCRKALRASSRLITDRELVRFQLRQPSVIGGFIAGKMSWCAQRSHKPLLGRVRFPPPQPRFTRAPGLHGVVAALAMRIFSRVQSPGGPPSFAWIAEMD